MSLHWKVLAWMLAGVVFGLGLQRFVDGEPYSGLSIGSSREITGVTGPGAKEFSVGDVVTELVFDSGLSDERRIHFTETGLKEELLSGHVVGVDVFLSPRDLSAWLLTEADSGERDELTRVLKEWEQEISVDPAYVGIVITRGSKDVSLVPATVRGLFDEIVSERAIKEVLGLTILGGKLASVILELGPTSLRAKCTKPFEIIASIFMSLLKMLIVPLVLSSIVCGVAGVGTMNDLGRLGGKTFLYYISTSLFAICVGQTLVNLIQPGVGAELGLSGATDSTAAPEIKWWEIFERMVPSNIFEAFTDNRAMLQIIFFALLLGLFITKAGAPHSERMRGIFESFFAVMMKMAEGILFLLPYGVFALLVKVVAKTGFAVFEPLLLYMGTVALALVIHACLTLPILLKVVGGLNPVRWAKAMSPALMTAFSTSSSAMTLPVTMRSVEERGKVSSKVTSFTLPLGATINMDGTALYECIGVIFLAQYYGWDLTMSQQALIVVMALMASIGAAGIPSAGLVMMLTILSALGLPVEGAALLLAVDRPLDMLRTVVNVWSDSCGAAIIARTEGETDVLDAGT